ncbi:MAG: OsmC family protein [Candidatus Thermoplasmatota archaeon]
MDLESATATPTSPVAVTIRARHHAIVQDKPVASGGKDAGPMASELLLASLLACQHSTFVKVATKRRVVAAVASLDGELAFANGDIAAIRVHFVLDAPAATDEQVATLLRLTDKACTISQALKLPVEARFTRA